MPERLPTFYAASYLILQKDNQVLLLRRAKTGWMDGFWGMPAGHIEGTESVDEAVRREAKEEIGISLEKSDVRLAHVLHRLSEDGRTYFDFFFIATSWSGEVTNAEPDKHDEFQWFPIGQLPDTLIPYLRRILERISKSIFFSEDVTE